MRRDGGRFLLSGSKAWITNASLSPVIITHVKTNPDAGSRGFSMILVETDTPGLHIAPAEKKMGTNGSPAHALSFTDVRVPLDHLLGISDGPTKDMDLANGWQRYAAIRGLSLEDVARRLGETAAPDPDEEIARIDAVGIEQVVEAANNGDRFARNVMVRAGDALGTKLADVANLFNPELIILRGPVIDGNAFLFERIRGVVMHETLRPTARALRLAFSAERRDIRFAGVASAILMDYFAR